MVERGDVPGFEEFVTARGPRLLRVAWLLTGDAHLAEDLLQTALAKVWPKWHRIAGDSPEAYVRRTLVTTHASWWRRRWRGEVPHGELPERAGEGDAFAEVDLEQALATAIRALPTRQRAVVVLRYFEDLTVEDTARTLGCSTGTVKSQSVKALRTLRRWLPDPAPDERAALADALPGHASARTAPPTQSVPPAPPTQSVPPAPPTRPTPPARSAPPGAVGPPTLLVEGGERGARS